MRVMMLALLLAGCSEGGREAVFVEPGDESSPVLDAAQADQGKADTEPPGDAAQGVSTRTETVACDLQRLVAVSEGSAQQTFHFARAEAGVLHDVWLCDPAFAAKDDWVCGGCAVQVGYEGPDPMTLCRRASRVYRESDGGFVILCDEFQTAEVTYLD